MIYRTYSMETRTIEIITAVSMEKALKSIWRGISFLAWGKKFGKVEISFRGKATARLHSATAIKW